MRKLLTATNVFHFQVGSAHVDSDVFRLHFDHEVSIIKLMTEFH